MVDPYEQAATWCEERAAKMLAEYEKRGRPDPSHAAWVKGCADTIRHNAEKLRAVPAGAPRPSDERQALRDAVEAVMPHEVLAPNSARALVAQAEALAGRPPAPAAPEPTLETLLREALHDLVEDLRIRIDDGVQFSRGTMNALERAEAVLALRSSPAEPAAAPGPAPEGEPRAACFLHNFACPICYPPMASPESPTPEGR